MATALAVARAAGARPPDPLPPASPPASAGAPVCDQATEAELRESFRLASVGTAPAMPAAPSALLDRGALGPATGGGERTGGRGASVEDVIAYLRALEPRRAALLYQVRSGSRLCTWLVSPRGTASHAARVDAEELAAAPARLLAALGLGGVPSGGAAAPRQPGQAQAALRATSAVVFPPPLAEKLLGERIDALVILPVPELEGLPFAALPVGLGALVDVAAVQVAPGLEPFALPPDRARHERESAVVLSGLARNDEAGAVARMLRASPRVGRAATASSLERVVRQTAPRLGTLYVAAASAPGSPAGVPALSLSERLFTPADIGRLPLRGSRPVVVLAVEEERPGAGGLPLARAFARAGASAVAASLWAGGDRAAPALVTRFLSESAEAPPDLALRAAMLAARKVQREPAHWARLALVGVPLLQGEWSPRRPCATRDDCGPSARCRAEACEREVLAKAVGPGSCGGSDRFDFEAGIFESPLSRAARRDIAACAESGRFRLRVVAPSRRRLDATVQSLLAFGIPRDRILADGGAALCDGGDPPECRRVELKGEYLPGAAPPGGEGAPSETLRVVRYPSVQASALMRTRQSYGVVVSLPDRRETPTVVEGPGGAPSPGGGVAVEVPRAPDVPEEAAWRVRVELSMPDATVTPGSADLLFRADGSGVPASFTVRPTWTPVHPSERRETPLLAVFSREGKVFARALRMITVTDDPAVGPPAEAPALLQGGAPEAEGRQADLYVQVLTIPRAAGGPPDADRVIVSAKLVGEPGLATDMGVRMDGLDALLVERYGRLSGLAPRGVAEAPPSPEERAAAAKVAAAALRQLGQDLWDRYTPAVLREEILRLQREKPSGADVRIQTNDPRVPWELLLVPVDGRGECASGARCEFLGVLHRVSRWHVGPALGVNPDVRTREGDVAVVAPDYDAPLDGVALEREALARLGARVRPVAGRFAPLLEVLAASPAPAVLHYAGHGEARSGAVPALERFGLVLEDRLLDLDTFRQHAAWRTADRGVGPLVFLNACDVGRAAGAYGFVEGWGPAALERGAAGFVGGLWPLGDGGAAEFSRRFYEAAVGGAGIAEAVRRARAAYADSGDPTFAAYVFYGHPDLRIAGGR